MLDKKKIVIAGLGAGFAAAFIMSIVSFVLFLRLDNQVDQQAAAIQANASSTTATLEQHTAVLEEIVAFLKNAVQANQGAPESAPETK